MAPKAQKVKSQNHVINVQDLGQLCELLAYSRPGETDTLPEWIKEQYNQLPKKQQRGIEFYAMAVAYGKIDVNFMYSAEADANGNRYKFTSKKRDGYRMHSFTLTEAQVRRIAEGKQVKAEGEYARAVDGVKDFKDIIKYKPCSGTHADYRSREDHSGSGSSMRTTSSGIKSKIRTAGSDIGAEVSASFKGLADNAIEAGTLAAREALQRLGEELPGYLSNIIGGGSSSDDTLYR